MVDWSQIVEEHGPYVWRTAYRLLSNREEANDCYQETFLSALQYSRRQQVTSWPGLLKRIATSKSLDRLRKRYRDRTEPLENSAEIAADGQSPDGRMQHEEWMQTFRQAVADLPDRYGEVFCLSELERLSHHEIALQFETNKRQVATWLYRAKQKLQQLLVERGCIDEVKQ